MRLERSIQVKIENRIQSIKLTVENSTPKYYYVECITETGFDLCNLHYGYYKAFVPVTKRLRAEKSIRLDMLRTLDAYEIAINRDAETILLSAKEVTVRISGTEYYSADSNIRFGEACNIKSKESGKCIAWHPHDVYKQGEVTVTVWRGTDGQLHMEAKESDLYDTDKVQTLVNSDDFQAKRFAFFFYEEAKRLVGMKHGDVNSMSGLFR